MEEQLSKRRTSTPKKTPPTNSQNLFCTSPGILVDFKFLVR